METITPDLKMRIEEAMTPAKPNWILNIAVSATIGSTLASAFIFNDPPEMIIMTFGIGVLLCVLIYFLTRNKK